MTGSFPRAQFVLSPSEHAVPDGWRALPLDGEWRLAVHPELSVTQSGHEGRRLVLLGYALDPAHPARSDADIADAVLLAGGGVLGITRSVLGLGGRWVMIWQAGDELVVFADAAGLRSVFWGLDAGNRPWCGSQPALLPELVRGNPDQEARAFLRRFAATSPEYWWPTDRTQWTGVRRLLPNHLLDLSRGAVRRWWPSVPLHVPPIEEILTTARAILEGTMQAAARRFRLAIALSAGIDSRVVLAAARSVAGELRVYSGRRQSMGADHMDLEVPERLAATLGLSHAVIAQPALVSPDVAEALTLNAPDVHAMRAPGVQAELAAFGRNLVGVTGNVSEVARVHYRKRGEVDAERLDGAALAAVMAMPPDDFAARAMDEWLADVGSPEGFDILDLCYWENRCGSWLSGNCLEFDVAWRDVLMPFNNRQLLELMLAAPAEQRSGSTPALYYALVEAMWPEALSEPVNPRPERPSSASSLLPRLVRQIRSLARGRR